MEINIKKYKYLLNFLLITGTIILIDGLLNIFKLPSIGTLVIYPISNILFSNDLSLVIKHIYPSLWLYIFILSILLNKWISYIEKKSTDSSVENGTILINNRKNKSLIYFTIFYWVFAVIITSTISLSSDSLVHFIRSTFILVLFYIPPFIIFLTKLPKTLKVILGTIFFIIITIALTVFSYLFKATLPMFDGSYTGAGCNSIVGKNFFTGTLKEYTCTRKLPWYESEVGGNEALSFLQQNCIEVYGKEYDACYSYLPIEWKTYTNTPYNFSVNYPSKLPMVIDGDWSFDYQKADFKEANIYFGPISNENGYPENSIWEITIINIADMSKYNRDIETEIDNFTYRVERSHKGDEPLRENIDINGLPATLVSISATKGQGYFMFRELYIENNGFLFIIRDSWDKETGAKFETFYKSIRFN